MNKVPGIADVGVYNVGGQPSLLVSIDRIKAARFGFCSRQDVNSMRCKQRWVERRSRRSSMATGASTLRYATRLRSIATRRMLFAQNP